MILIDANLLLYAYDKASDQNKRAQQWLETLFEQPQPVRLAWATILAFLRISTNPRAFHHPLATDEALAVVTEWLSLPNVDIINPTERHFEILGKLLRSGQATASLVTDAHLAALAIEHGAVLYTADRDFARFAGLKFSNPLEES